MKILVTILPLIGVLIGTISTYFIQTSSFKRQQKWEKEKMEIQFIQEQMKKKLESYNRIIKAHSESMVIDWHPHTGESSFKGQPYMDKIRPELYDSFHFLHPDIADAVMEIDSIGERWEVMGDDPDDEELLISHYTFIIDSIKKELNDYRKKYIGN